MRYFVPNVLKQAAAGFTSFVLVLSSVSAAVPIFLSQNAGAVSTIAYNTIPAAQPSSYASQAYQAQSTSEFGDHVRLAGSDRILNTATVSLTNWACENDAKLVGGVWTADRAAGVACATTPGSTFNHPVTLNIYSVNNPTGTPSLGSLIKTVTKNVDVPFRPSADPSCTEDRWKDASGKCYSGYAFNVDFDLSVNAVALPRDVIVAVAYNTQSYGTEPTGQPGPYNSLNVSLASNGANVGTDVEPNAAFWKTSHAPFYTDGGAGGVNTLRRDTGWTPYTIAMTLKTNPALVSNQVITGNTSAGENLPGWMFNRDQDNVTPFAFSGAAGSTGVGSLYVKPIGANASDKFIAENFTQTPVSEFNSLSYDYKIASNGTDADKNKFYTNVYANVDSSNNFFDCRFDYVANVGSTAGFVTSTFSATDTPTLVKQRGTRTVCPATLAEMPSGSFIRAYAVTAGDTTTSDLGLAAYYDNVVINTSSLISNYDLEPTPIAAPNNFMPVNGTTTNNNDFDMSWPAVAGATKYEYRTSNDLQDPTTLGQLVHSDNSVSSNYTVGADKIVRGNTNAPDANYYWQVRAGNDDGTWSPWSVISKVTVDTEAPTTPTSGLPNNSYEKDNDFYFTWSGSADAGSQVKYEFQSSGSSAIDGNGSLVGAWNSTTSGNPEQNNLTTPTIHSTGAPDSKYYWQVRAFDAAGNKSAWSTVWSMTIDSNIPDVPSNLNVAVGALTLTSPAMTSSANITTSWKAVPGATSYIYKYWNDIALNKYKKDTAYEVAVTGTSVSGTFTEGEGTHYVAIKAVDAAGNQSAWSEPFVVTYDKTAPLLPVATLSAGGFNILTAGTTNSKTFTFNLASSDPARYQVKYWNDIAGSPFKLNSPWSLSNLSGYSSALGVYNDQFTQGQGTHYFAFSACDATGNCSGFTDPFVVTFDNVNPVVTINEIATDTTQPTITGTLDELNARDFTVTLDGVALDVTQTEIEWSALVTEPLVDGLHTLLVVGTDLAGNPFTATREFTTVVPVAVAPAPVVTPVIPSAPAPAPTTTTPTQVVAPQSLPQNQAAFSTTPAVDAEVAVLGATTSEESVVDVAGAQTSKNVAAATVDTGGNGFFGLAWYWWLAILAAIATTWWFIAAMRRRNDQNA